MSKGRPRIDSARDLPATLVMATQQSLVEKSHLDLTARDISVVAGTQPSMINYYFGGKDELVFETVATIIEQADQRLALAEQIIANAPDPTRELVQELNKAYCEAPPLLLAVIITEVSRPGSKIRAEFERRHGARIYDRVSRLIERLIDKGVYRADLDVKTATLALFSLIGGRATFLPIWKLGASCSEGVSIDDWEVQIATMFNLYCRAGRGGMPSGAS